MKLTKLQNLVLWIKLYCKATKTKLTKTTKNINTMSGNKRKKHISLMKIN